MEVISLKRERLIDREVTSFGSLCPPDLKVVRFQNGPAGAIVQLVYEIEVESEIRTTLAPCIAEKRVFP